jgi:hypothetical protein
MFDWHSYLQQPALPHLPTIVRLKGPISAICVDCVHRLQAETRVPQKHALPTSQANLVLAGINAHSI